MTSNPAHGFAERVWFTRKAWIEAEKRLLSNEYHTQLLLVVYSAYTTCISVILLAYEPPASDKKLLDTSMVVLAVALLALSLYLNSKSFKDRASRFKVGYLELHDIEGEARFLAPQMGVTPPAPAVSDGLKALSDRYTKTLREVENHSELDDIRARIGAGKGLLSRHLTLSDYGHFYCWRFERILLLATMYIAPAAAILWYLYK